MSNPAPMFYRLYSTSVSKALLFQIFAEAFAHFGKMYNFLIDKFHICSPQLVHVDRLSAP